MFKKLGHKPDCVAVGIVSVDLKVLRRARPKSMRFYQLFGSYAFINRVVAFVL